MLLDSNIVPQTIVKPSSFVGLMALYESNFLRLFRLMPELDRLDGCYKSRVAGDCDLYLEVLERCRYTLTLALTYRFPSDTGLLANPDVRVRVYLDGQQAEAMTVGGEDHRHTELRRLARAHRAELSARWRRNMILNKWLDYLTEQGHLILDAQP